MYYIDCYDDNSPVMISNRQKAIDAFKASLEPYREWLDEISKEVHVSLYDEKYRDEFEPLYEQAITQIDKFQKRIVDEIDIPKIGAVYYKDW